MADVEFIDNSDAVRELLSRATRSAAEIIGGMVENQAGEYAMRAKGPKGNSWPLEELNSLRQSMTHQIEDTDKGPVLTVGSNLEIAPYIELGTGKFYQPGPEWIQYHGDDAHSVGGLDFWYYRDEITGEIKVGMPQHASPYLRPAFMDHVEDIKAVVQGEMENAPD